MVFDVTQEYAPEAGDTLVFLQQADCSTHPVKSDCSITIIIVNTHLYEFWPGWEFKGFKKKLTTVDYSCWYHSGSREIMISNHGVEVHQLPMFLCKNGCWKVIRDDQA